MPVTKVGSRWSSGNLIFYESAVSRATIADILTLTAGDSGAVTVGSATNDIDFKYYGTGSLSAIINCGAATFTLVGIATSTNGAVTITNATATSSTTTGALIVTGGIATAAGIWVGTTSRLVGAITADATLGIAGKITSTSTTGISFNPTLVPDANRTNYIWSYGTRATAKDLSMAASASYNLDPIQVNLNIIGTAPTSSTVNLSYMLITHAFAHMTGLRLKCSDWTVSVAKNILDAYVYQGEIDITASTAIGSEATVMGLTMSVSAGTVTGLVRGLAILMSGASMPANAAAVYVNIGGSATLTHGLLLATQGGTTLTNGIYVEQGGTLTNFLKFDATSAAVVSTASGGGTRSYSVRCAVGGVTGYLSLYTD